MARSGVVIALLLLLAGTACNSIVPRTCTLEARASATVTVKDERGNPIADAEVVFSVDGSDEEACDGFSGTYSCGWEQEGTFVITARKTGYDDAQQSLEIGPDADGCHVEGESLTLTLVATPP